ncbi:MAG: PHP-associated domain-containing protein [Bryobacteraceae bacterium]
MKCDLHVHTRFSGMCTIPVLRHFCRESYNEPLAVYETLKQRGMDLVTVTDHDAIGASEELRKFDDFFLSEEVTCILPSGNELHVGVYNITERQHLELQRRRNDMPSFTEYLAEQRLFSSANHVFSALTGSRTADDFRVMEASFPALEVRNGQMPETSNAHAARLARLQRKAVVAGSDCHTLASLGRTFTEIAGARSTQDYFDLLRRGAAVACGEHGNYAKLTKDVLRIGGSWMAESRWATVLFPLAAVAPLVTLASSVAEHRFADRWSRRLLASEPLGPAIAALQESA